MAFWISNLRVQFKVSQTHHQLGKGMGCAGPVLHPGGTRFQVFTCPVKWVLRPDSMVSGSPNLQKNLTHQLLGCSSGSSLGHGRSFWPPWKEINAHRHVLLRTTFW
ncbi:hypothetical protein GDO81_022683 [Engystomops pustulosus]|uniref:Uncharacterized protein n=1 Tax=Engystomops pustulosus TaxID=76066 RepID=A0AAV6YTH6_ENGPU|nr:hypothetical protein GDO81_022683 [Engystomops pustulosus]